MKKLQSEEDYLYECLINKLTKKQETDSTIENRSSEHSIPLKNVVQQKQTSSIREVNENDSFSDDSGSSADKAGSNIAQRLRKKLLDQVTDKVKEIAEEMGIDPSTVKLTTDAK